MQKSTLVRKGRKGFTLVEVALAVAVGLIIIGGAVLGYNAVKDNASNSNARNRVLSAVTIVEEYSAANSGRYPGVTATGTTGTFGTMWKNKRPDDFSASPWGGSAGDTTDGCKEGSVAFAGNAAQASATVASAALPDIGTVGTAVAADAADMIYLPVTNWASITTYSTSSAAVVKNYAVGIFDKNGQPFWDCKGGK